jgi:hypothetical protein
MNKENNPKAKRSFQKCWHCKNVATCDWGKYGKPIEGWKAKKAKIKCGRSPYIETYDIKDCPKFEQGEPETNIQNYDLLIEAIIRQWRVDFVSTYLGVLIEEYRLGTVTKPTRKEYEIERSESLNSILSDLLGEKVAETAVERAESDAERYFDIAKEWSEGADEKELAEKVGKDSFDISMKFLRSREPFKSKRRESLKNQEENGTI